MSNVMRWRYGDTSPVVLPVRDDLSIEIGDLLYREGGVAMPAECVDEYKTELRSTFHDKFLGVAMQASPEGVGRPIRIGTSGVFEFDCSLAMFEVGSLIGPAVEEDSLVNQRVDLVLDVAFAVGRCAKRVATPSTRVLVEIVSTVMRGGQPQ